MAMSLASKCRSTWAAVSPTPSPASAPTKKGATTHAQHLQATALWGHGREQLMPLGNASGGRLKHAPRPRRIVAAAETSSKVGFLGKLGRVLKEKASSDISRLFSGVEKSRDGLKVVDELLGYWTLTESEDVLDELEEALLVADFGPRTTVKIIAAIRKDIVAGKIKSGSEIKDKLREEVVKLLTRNVKGSSELQLPDEKPGVIMVVGVNGGGKTTTIGKLAHRLKNEGVSILLAAGDTFRAAGMEQLEKWAERVGTEFVHGQDKTRPASVLSAAVRKAKEMEGGVDVVICDTSGRLHNNFALMDELAGCKRALQRQIPSAPHEVLLVLDGTTGLNMLPQAREFNQCVGVTGLVLTKLDGTARGGCVVSVVDDLGIPIKFVGVGESLEDLQPFDAASFANALLG